MQELARVAAACISALLTLASATPAAACTGVRLHAEDGAVIQARTLEFGFDIQSSVLVIPAGTEFTGSLPDGGEGLAYKTRYAMAGADAVGQDIIVDGVNEAGLAFGLFYFPGYAQYPGLDDANRARGMAPHEFGTWVLGSFATVTEVRDALDQVVLLPVVLEVIGVPTPAHYLITDRSGASIVIEPVGGLLLVHDNPLGVITNSPTFDWHVTNLRNYVNLTATNVPPVALAGLDLYQFGEGSGMLGLPGDWTPPSRFVRAAAFSQSLLPSANAREAVLQAFHLLNVFDIPRGAVRSIVADEMHADYTLWTSAIDTANARYYFHTYEDRSVRVVDLKKAVQGRSEIGVIPMKGEQPVLDVSTAFE